MNYNYRRDDGVTLIELIASLTMATVIISTLSAALIGFYQNGAYTSRRDSHSAGKSIFATYLMRDLARGEEIATSGLTTPGCGLSGSAFVVRWWEYDVTSATNPTPIKERERVATYSLEADSFTVRPGVTGLQQLRRRTCLGPAPGTVQDNQILIRDLATGDFTVGGSAGTCSNGGVAVALTIRRYEQDIASADQVIRGCVDGRQR